MAQNLSIGAGVVDTNNTSVEGDYSPTIALPFVGEWAKNDNFPNIMVTMACDVAGTVFFDFYDRDGNTPTGLSSPTSTFPVTGFQYANPPFNEFHQATKGPRWFRVRFVPDTDLATTFRINSYFVVKSEGNLPINQSISADQDATITRAIPEGNLLDDSLEPTDDYAQVGVLSSNALSVGLAPAILAKATISLPTGSAVTIDPVLNTEPNVYDSGWIASAAYHSQLFHAKLDGVADVFLMNSPDTLGTNFTGGDFKFTSTAAGAPAEGGAMFKQGYFRVLVQNTSGVTVSGQIESKGHFSALGPILLPIGADLFDFFPLPATQTVSKGRTPAGSYVALPVGGIDPQNSSQDNLGIAGTFVGEYQRTSGYSSALVFALSDVPLDSVIIQWSEDGVTPRSGLLSTSTLTEVETGGFYIYLTTITTMIDQYFRLEVTNGATATTIFEADSWLYDDPFPGSYGALDATLSSISTALLTRAVIAGTTPDGGFENAPIGGQHTANSTSTPLGAGGVFRGDWFQGQGKHTTMLTTMSSDVNGQVFIDFSEEETPTNGDESSVEDSLVIAYDPNITPVFRRITPIQSKWVRVRYQNDAVAQTTFNLGTSFTPTASPLVMQRMAENVSTNMLAGLVKAGITAPDGADEFRPIGRVDDSLKTAVTDFEPEVDIRTNEVYESWQTNVTSTSASQLQAASMLNPRTVSFTNPSPDTAVYTGPDASVTVNNGHILLPLNSRDMDTSAPIFAIAASGGGDSENTYNLDADTVDSSSGVTSPSNMFASDDTYAVFSDEADTATISGFNGASVVDDEITSVKIMLEAKKESGAAGETAAYEDSNIVSSGSTGGGSPITSGAVTAVTGHTYFVCIARENTGAALTSVSSTMGFSGSTTVQDLSNGGESRMTVIQMTGTPTSDGTISVTLSAASNHDVISVISVSNVAAVQSIDTDSSTSTGSFSLSASGTENGIALGFVACELANVNTPVTDWTTREKGGSAANDDQTLWVGTRALTATGAVALSGTMDGGTNDDMTAILVTVLPADALDPIIVVTHSEGATTLTQQISIESDTIYEADITTDATWTSALVDNMTLTISPSLIGNADLDADRLWLEVVGSSSVVRISGSWIGDNG